MTQSLGSTLFGQICFGFSMNFIISWEKKPFTKSKKYLMRATVIGFDQLNGSLN